MPECRVIPYFKGFLTELKEILSLGGTCTGGMLGDLHDFLRANTSATTPPTAATNNNFTTTSGSSVNNNNPTLNSSSSSALGSFNAALNSSTVNNSSSSSSSSSSQVHQNVGFSGSYINNNNSSNISNNNNNISGTMNKNLLSGDSNCVKPINNVGPSKGSQSGSGGEATVVGSSDVADSTTRGMQTVNVSSAARSPQDQRHPPKNSQQKVVSLWSGAWACPAGLCRTQLVAK